MLTTAQNGSNSQFYIQQLFDIETASKKPCGELIDILWVLKVESPSSYPRGFTIHNRWNIDGLPTWIGGESTMTCPLVKTTTIFSLLKTHKNNHVEVASNFHWSCIKKVHRNHADFCPWKSCLGVCRNVLVCHPSKLRRKKCVKSISVFCPFN